MFKKSKKINTIKISQIREFAKELKKHGINILIETIENRVDKIDCRAFIRINREQANKLSLEYSEVEEVQNKGGGEVTTKELVKKNSKLIKKNSDAILGLTKLMTKFIGKQETHNAKQDENWKVQKEFNAKQDENWKVQKEFNAKQDENWKAQKEFNKDQKAWNAAMESKVNTILVLPTIQKELKESSN